MLFSSPLFVFLFLPLCLAAYAVVPRRLGNPVLLAASLVFYAWGEQEIVLVMLASIAGNWLLGLWVERARGGPRPRWPVGVAVAFNLGLLVVFKYANFLWGELGRLAGLLGLGAHWPELAPIHLPIGISFFTFQALSYVIDVYRQDGPVQKSPVRFATYIALFPQLVAGPIVRYRDIAAELAQRRSTLPLFASGVRRFAVGLGKKMLIANVVARAADGVFALPSSELTPGAAWLGVTCYTLQIYFDFSGYSDMAIGLGRMFGFHFLENFEHPYVARSVTDFWRRWHISLSSWFRDYLYIPLGGNRAGRARTYLNLVLVFFLCGLWHGASWSFVVWGLWHGAFLVVERVGLARALLRRPVLRHFYVLLIVMLGWVFFRADTLGHAGGILLRMFGLGAVSRSVPLELARTFCDPFTVTALAAGLIGSVPLVPWLARWRSRQAGARPRLALALELAGTAALGAVLLASAAMLAADTYNPFIYFRF